MHKTTLTAIFSLLFLSIMCFNHFVFGNSKFFNNNSNITFLFRDKLFNESDLEIIYSDSVENNKNKIAIDTFKLFPELAKTPPMGWNSWNYYGCKINENLIKKTALTIANNGMKDAGYQYIVLDDCWVNSLDKHGKLVADTINFPSGIKNLSDYIHSLGLKFGIYTSIGNLTCQNKPGSKSYEEIHAKQFAEWEVDYLKYDWCGSSNNSLEDIKKMSFALHEKGRPIVLSISEWGKNKPWKTLTNYVHLWRTSEDIGKCYYNETMMNWPDIIDKQDSLAKYVGPGRWNDPDMLQVGNSCLNHEENKAHFSLYALVSAPLFAGNNILEMPHNDLEIFTNKEVIKVNQDPLGKQGIKLKHVNDLEIWIKELENKEFAFVLFNKSDCESKISFSLKELGIEKTSKIRDLWKHEDLGYFKSDEVFSQFVPSHSVFMGRISPK